MTNETEYEDATASGFTEDINSEMADRDISKFTDFRELYVSKSGHSRLFVASRYGKRYALKCLKQDFMLTPVYRMALRKEFEIGLQLDHPNICRTFSMEDLPELGQTIVMEYIDGKSLQQLIDENRLTAQLGEKIVEETADALDYMHSKQIFHRDLKPSNIMITHNGQNVKVIDFSLSDSDAFDILKQPAGSKGYIAPELLQPHATTTIQSDIYSLGMVINDIFAFTGNTKMNKMAQVCMEKEPSRRPTSKQMILDASRHTPLWQWLIVIALSIVSILLVAHIIETLLTASA